MNPVHANFKILFDLKEVLSKNIVYISDLTPDRTKWFSWIPLKIVRQICFQTLTSLDMTKVVIKSRKAEAIFIFEHKPQYSFLLYLVCILKNVPVFFIVHGIQQSQKKSVFHYFGCEVLRMLVQRGKFWPIHLEISDKEVVEIRPFNKSIVIPHPLAEESCCNRNRNRIETFVGVVGMLRQDKPILQVIEFVLEYIKSHENVKVFVGTPFWQVLPIELKKMKVDLIDTTSKKQYFDFLKTLDIVIADFDRDSFYFRPSGIINDAVSCGCFVIAPDYPVFKAQLSRPVKVGETYQSLDDLNEVFTSSINYIRDTNVDFNSWREARKRSFIVNELGSKMKNIIETKSKIKVSCD
ncbi:MAG TPA: hypothetical protein VD794_08205 [Flavisolibacter sp.]|nr:hypothetical protein [Flavisolibacter sp.]